MPGNSNKEAAVALATLASPVRSVKLSIARSFRLTIQPGAGEPDMLDETSVPCVHQVQVAVLCLDQVRVRELEAAVLRFAFISLGRPRIVSRIGDAGIGSPRQPGGDLSIARLPGGQAMLVFKQINAFPAFSVIG